MSTRFTTNPNPARLRLGARVQYRGTWGSDPAAPGIITGWGEKRGETIWDVLLNDGRKHWGYADQFEPLALPPITPASPLYPQAGIPLSEAGTPRSFQQALSERLQRTKNPPSLSPPRGMPRRPSEPRERGQTG